MITVQSKFVAIHSLIPHVTWTHKHLVYVHSQVLSTSHSSPKSTHFNGYASPAVTRMTLDITSAMPRILGERERPHWLWPKGHMPCRVFYDSRPNTALNKLLTGGQHGRCSYSVRFTVETHSVLLFHVEMSIRREVQQALTPRRSAGMVGCGKKTGVF